VDLAGHLPQQELLKDTGSLINKAYQVCLNNNWLIVQLKTMDAVED